MDPVKVIVAALVAGAAAEVGDAATSPVKDAYAGLRTLVKKRFAGTPAAEEALEEHEKAPDTWEQALRQQLAVTGTDQDADILAAAQALLKGAHAAGINTKYNVDVTGDVGAGIGDHGDNGNIDSVESVDAGGGGGGSSVGGTTDD